MTIIFETNDFENTHGRKPRGFGCWAFRIQKSTGWSDPVFVQGGMGYAEAKKAFRKMIQSYPGNLPRVLRVSVAP